MPASPPTTIGQAARPLNSRDYRTLSLAALGGALEFYDFVVYVFFAPVIGQLFFPATMPDWQRLLQTFGIFAAGYLSRPLGGILIGHFGDLLGRKRMFTLSIFLMAVPTLAIGLLPTYAAIGVAAPLLLLLMRILQGAAIGGEVPGAWVFVAEHVPAQRFGLAVGTLTAGLTLGILIGSLMASAISVAFSAGDVARYAWRLPFILGGGFGLVSVYLRRFLEETPVFKELSARRSLARELPLKSVLREHRAATLLALALTWVLSAGIVVVILFTPTYLREVHHIPATLALPANSLATLALAIGCLAFGWISDRVGTRLTMMVGFAGLLVTSSTFYAMLPGTPTRDGDRLRPHRLLRRRSDDGTDGCRAILPGGRSLHRPLVFVQRLVRDLRGTDANRAAVVAENEPDGAGVLRGWTGDSGIPAGAGADVGQPALTRIA